MPDLLERIREIRGEDRIAPLMEDIKTQISIIPHIDTDAIIRDIHNALLPIFNTQNTIAADRQNEVIQSISKLTEEVEEKLEDSSEKYNKTLSLVSDVLKGLSKEVNAIEIPETDLSNIEQAIKDIKPTDLTRLENQIDMLSKAVISLKNTKPPKPEKIDLKPVLEAMNRTKTVTFEVETDQWDFPTKVIATERYSNGSNK